MKIFSPKRAQWAFVLFSTLLGNGVLSAQDIKPEEIVARHLESIGKKEKRDGIKNRMVVGTARFNILRSPTYSKGKISTGRTVFLSEGNKIFVGIKFESLDYPFDEIVYDEKNVHVAYIKPGNRSVIGNFIISHRYIVSEGLFGGVLSTGWGLLDLDSHQAKIKSGGKKKINGRQAYALNYLIKGGSPLSIKLFFDTQTFQHLRTEYQQVFAAPVVAIQTESAGQVQTIHRLIEDFSNFKEVDGVTLPYSYQINLLIDGKLTNEFQWNAEFSETRTNQNIDPVSFEIQSNP